MLFFLSFGKMMNNKNENLVKGITSTGISWWRAKTHMRIGI